VNDPDRDGYVEFATRWRIVGDEGSVVNWASLFDDFVMWKKEMRGVGGTPHMQFYVHWSVNLHETSFAREQAYDKYQFILQTKHLPPMWGGKELLLGGGNLVKMHIEVEGDSTLSFKWTGNMMAFADALTTEGVRGAVCDAGSAGQLQNTYARILRNLEATSAFDRIHKVLDDCFRCLSMPVVVEQPHPSSGTPAFACIEALRGIPALHFLDE
jgi:hypothetical protein